MRFRISAFILAVVIGGVAFWIGTASGQSTNVADWWTYNSASQMVMVNPMKMDPRCAHGVGVVKVDFVQRAVVLECNNYEIPLPAFQGDRFEIVTMTPTRTLR